MFLKKLFNFNKDYTHYLEKGDRYLAAERFADARNAYGEALEKLGAAGEADPSLVEDIRRKIALTGNMLGRLNLVEAEHALAAGDGKKAEEHLHILLDLADDPALREKAEGLLAESGRRPPEVAQVETVPDSGSEDEVDGEEEDEEPQAIDDSIAEEDRLALYFQTLPGDLPERYAAMGDEFARACLLTLEGDGEGALRAFEALPAGAGSDILDYEKAILYFHNGDTGKCEQLLTDAIEMNPANPLCHIGLVHLFTETGRGPEALQVLERMISNDVIPDQARMMQGDVYALLKDESNAIESYSKLLTSPGFAKAAAERIVPILERQGRTKEAAYLIKKFLKGCR